MKRMPVVCAEILEKGPGHLYDGRDGHGACSTDEVPGEFDNRFRRKGSGGRNENVHPAELRSNSVFLPDARSLWVRIVDSTMQQGKLAVMDRGTPRSP